MYSVWKQKLTFITYLSCFTVLPCGHMNAYFRYIFHKMNLFSFRLFTTFVCMFAQITLHYVYDLKELQLKMCALLMFGVYFYLKYSLSCFSNGNSQYCKRVMYCTTVKLNRFEPGVLLFFKLNNAVCKWWKILFDNVLCSYGAVCVQRCQQTYNSTLENILNFDVNIMGWWWWVSHADMTRCHLWVVQSAADNWSPLQLGRKIAQKRILFFF